MVAENGVDSHRSLQAAKGAHKWSKLIGATVDYIAGEDDQIGMECVDGIDDLGHICRIGAIAAYVQIGNLSDRQALECLRQSRIGVVDLHHIDIIAVDEGAPPHEQERTDTEYNRERANNSVASELAHQVKQDTYVFRNIYAEIRE